MNWFPFLISEQYPDPPRSLIRGQIEGVGDRLRAAAFAELQAESAFLWAAEYFRKDAPSRLIEKWKILAKEERKHFSWLIERMKELNVNPSERKVSLGLWKILTSCKNAEDFCIIIADAENRGRISGEKIAEYLQSEDPQTAKIFLDIAKDEIEHIRLAAQFYPEKFSVFKTLKYFNF